MKETEKFFKSSSYFPDFYRYVKKIIKDVPHISCMYKIMYNKMSEYFFLSFRIKSFYNI